MIDFDFDNNDGKDPLVKVAAIIMGFLIAMILCGFLGSCRSCPDITDDMFIHDTVNVYQLQRDSLYVHDSIFQDRWMQGDTVYIQKYVEHIAYKDRLKHDSIYINMTDTIQTTVTKEKILTAWQKFKLAVGNFALLLFLLAGVVLALYFIFRKK